MSKINKPIDMRDATLPLTYEDALQEIVRLKAKLEQTEIRWARAVEDRAQMAKQLRILHDGLISIHDAVVAFRCFPTEMLFAGLLSTIGEFVVFSGRKDR